MTDEQIKNVDDWRTAKSRIAAYQEIINKKPEQWIGFICDVTPIQVKVNDIVDELHSTIAAAMAKAIGEIENVIREV